MKKLLSTILFTCLIFPLFSQVEMGKTKNTIMGKNKLLLTETNKMMLDNFSINLILYGFGEDQGGGGAQVGVRADLTEIDEPLAQEIVNEAYAYFVESWKKQGKELYTPTKEEIEASKKYGKALSKGKKAKIMNGGTINDHTKKNHNIMAYPDGVNIPFSGSGPMAIASNSGHGLGLDAKYSGFFTSFTSTINFVSFKSAALGSTASVKVFPQLKVTNSMNATVWLKAKVGGYIGGNSADGTKDFYQTLDQSEMEVLSTSANSWNYIGDKEKYKANVLEMIKKGMDDMFADLEAVKEKAK
jgi:hypothetical protein